MNQEESHDGSKPGKTSSEPESASLPVDFPSSTDEVGTNARRGQLHYSFQPPSHKQAKSGIDYSVPGEQPPNEDHEIESQVSDKTTLLDRVDQKCQDHPNSTHPHHKRRSHFKSKLSAAIVIGVSIIMLVSIGLYVGLKQKCLNALASSTEILIAKNSSVILLNTTSHCTCDLQTCYEPNITIAANFPMDVYLLPCQSVPYSNYTLVRPSFMYPDQPNPLPSGFDENYQNYLVNGHVNMTVNISTYELSPLTPEYFYFCMYTDYNQFQDFKSKSTKRYWKNYSGKQCNGQQLSGDNNAIVLKDTFNITQPEYVFIGFGSTVDPLNTFQFTVNISGQTLSGPGKSSATDSIIESCNLNDQQHSCQLALNLECNSESEAMCIIGSRPVDHVSTEPFKSLTVKWTLKPYKDIKTITRWVMTGAILSGFIIISLLCLVQGCICYKKYSICITRGPICEEESDDSHNKFHQEETVSNTDSHTQDSTIN